MMNALVIIGIIAAIGSVVFDFFVWKDNRELKKRLQPNLEIGINFLLPVHYKKGRVDGFQLIFRNHGEQLINLSCIVHIKLTEKYMQENNYPEITFSKTSPHLMALPCAINIATKYWLKYNIFDCSFDVRHIANISIEDVTGREYFLDSVRLAKWTGTVQEFEKKHQKILQSVR